MKFSILPTICMVLLTACSIPASGTATPTQTELPSPTQKNLPTATSTETPVPTLAGFKYCVVPNLLNLRSGPGIKYSIVTIEGQGTCGQATARNTDSTWVYFVTEKYTGWAYVQYLSGTGDLTSLPLYTELTPTP